MAFNLRNRSFLTLSDFNKREMEYMLDLAEDLKKAKYAGTEGKNLEGKNIALIFEKSSTRTRCSFEVGAKDEGAHTLVTRNLLRILPVFLVVCLMVLNTVVSHNAMLKLWLSTQVFQFGTV